MIDLHCKPKTFELKDLVNRMVSIRSFKDKDVELIIAQDLKSGEFFVLEQINHTPQIE